MLNLLQSPQGLLGLGPEPLVSLHFFLRHRQEKQPSRSTSRFGGVIWYPMGTGANPGCELWTDDGMCCTGGAIADADEG